MTQNALKEGRVPMAPSALILLLASFFSSPPIEGQVVPTSGGSCQVKELFKEEGWEIPGLSRTVLRSHGRYTSEGIPDNVFVDILESQAPQASLMFVGQSSEASRMEISIRSIDVTKIERFEMNGNVFGYRITGVIAAFDDSGRRIHFGSEEHAYYYDPVGSGKFSVMHYDVGEVIFKIVVPEWAKQTKKK